MSLINDSKLKQNSSTADQLKQIEKQGDKLKNHFEGLKLPRASQLLNETKSVDHKSSLAGTANIDKRSQDKNKS
jgi:hypothetical protein